MSHDATLITVTDDAGRHCVVTHADPVIWVDPDLWADINRPDRKSYPGAAEADGDLLTLGTDGEGLGRLTYRRTGYVHADGHYFIAFTRVDGPAAADHS